MSSIVHLKRKVQQFEHRHHPVIEDLLKLLKAGTSSDIILYGREEKPIQCHQLILTARCPNILLEMFQTQSSRSGKFRNFIALTKYSHAVVKAFVKLVYTGQISCHLNPAELSDIKLLITKYGMQVNAEELNIPPANKYLKTATTCTDTGIENKILHTELHYSSDAITVSNEERGDMVAEITPKPESQHTQSSSGSITASETPAYWRKRIEKIKNGNNNIKSSEDEGSVNVDLEGGDGNLIDLDEHTHNQMKLDSCIKDDLVGEFHEDDDDDAIFSMVELY